MQKKLNILILVITILFITACTKNEATKMIGNDYIKENNGITFNNYAIAIDEDSTEIKNYALFVRKANGRYKKLYVIEDYSPDDKLLATDKYLYIFYSDGGFIGYKLDENNTTPKKIECEFKEINGLIYFPIKIYGYKDEYIYLSYYKDEINKDILYAKIKYDLKEYKDLNSEDEIPKEVNNNIKTN